MWNKKKEKLYEIYGRYEDEASAFKKDAICKLGCTFCCTDAGSVDINTLEGLIIRERLDDFPAALKEDMTEKLARNRREKETRSASRCPFLDEDGACGIYDVRPFSCRQLYSIRECRDRGPTVHREAVSLAKKAIRAMQQLDDTGYSGHISFVLHLLDKPGFQATYRAGKFQPEKIMRFGKSHKLIINRFVT